MLNLDRRTVILTKKSSTEIKYKVYATQLPEGLDCRACELAFTQRRTQVVDIQTNETRSGHGIKAHNTAFS
jgi:hypothetical protein